MIKELLPIRSSTIIRQGVLLVSLRGIIVGLRGYSMTIERANYYLRVKARVGSISLISFNSAMRLRVRVRVKIRVRVGRT